MARPSRLHVYVPVAERRWFFGILQKIQKAYADVGVEIPKSTIVFGILHKGIDEYVKEQDNLLSELR